jgi:hypothetical protein
MVGPQQISFGEDLLTFHLPRTLRFSLLSFNECSLFLELRLAFAFRLDFCSDIVIYLYQGVFGPLVYIDIYQKSFFLQGYHRGSPYDVIKRVVSKRFEWCWKREKV